MIFRYSSTFGAAVGAMYDRRRLLGSSRSNSRSFNDLRRLKVSSGTCGDTGSISMTVLFENLIVPPWLAIEFMFKVKGLCVV